MTAELMNGVPIMITGIVVVLGLLALLAVCIEVVVRVDDLMTAGEKEKALPETGTAASESALPEEAEEISPEVAAVIGLALHEFFDLQHRLGKVVNITGPDASRWSASGRTARMRHVPAGNVCSSVPCHGATNSFAQ